MTPKVRRITPAQIERAIGVLGTVSENHDGINGRDRDDIAHVIQILDELAEAGGLRIERKQL